MNLGLGGGRLSTRSEFLCMVAGCDLGTDVWHWMFKQKSSWFKVNKIPL